jgi:Domain of unknown function (DUF5667)
MGRPNQTHDRLDALLDGRPDEVTDDLAPLLAAAEELRAELADFELDPEVIERHLEQALDRPATVVPLPVRKPGGSVLRRRLAAAGLAAALLLVPATAASAASSSALPGQALYPVKLAVEQFRLATVQWSPTREAQERAKVAAERLKELDRLVQLRMFSQVPTAIRALDKAVQAANLAVVEAAAEEGADLALLDVVNKLDEVTEAQHDELVALKEMGSQVPVAVTLAVDGSPAAEAPVEPPVLVIPAPATTVGPAPTQPPATAVSSPTTTPQSTAAATTQPEPPVTTSPPPPDPPTTTAPPTTAPPTTAAPPETAGTEGAEGSPAGAGGEASPPSTLGP